MVSRHIVGIHSGYAQFLQLLIATGITSTRKSSGMAIKLICQVISVAQAQEAGPPCVEQQFGDLRPLAPCVLECLCGQQLRKELCKSMSHPAEPTTALSEGRIGSLQQVQSPRNCPRISAASSISNLRRCKGPTHLHRVPLPLIQLHYRASSPNTGCFLIFL